MRCLNDETNMKQTSNKRRAHVVHVHFEYVCFMYASSCKRGLLVRNARFWYKSQRFQRLTSCKMLRIEAKQNKAITHPTSKARHTVSFI